jgi:pimeloyl-ACP methyl ester carboxylesterase
MNVRPVAWIGIVVCAGLGGGLAAAADSTSQPVVTKVASFDGTKLYCESRGNGETALLFLHGWCGTHDYWKHQVDVFAKDYQVVAIDQAGHGQSDKDRQEWTLDNLAADVEAVIKTLKLNRVILIGHSMGGPVSLVVAKRLPDNVVGIVGVDTLHNAEFEWPKEENNQFLTGLKQDFKGTMRSGMKGLLRDDVDPDLLEWLTSGAESQDPTMALGLMDDMSRRDARMAMQEAKVPIRCINATPTYQFAIPTQTEINKKYADFDAVEMDGVGHYPMLERPEEFNAKLAEILKGFANK